MATQLITPAADLLSEAVTWPDQARRTAIESAAQHADACKLLMIVKGLMEEANETFDPICAAAHGAWQVALEQRRKVTAPLTEAETIIKGKIAAWLTAERARIALIERIERERLERIAAEQREREIEAAEAEGASAEEVERICLRPVPVARITPRPMAKVAGVSPRENWSATVTDLPALIAYVARNPQFANLLSANLPAINGMARSMKSMMNIASRTARPSAQGAFGNERRND